MSGRTIPGMRAIRLHLTRDLGIALLLVVAVLLVFMA